MIVKNYDPFRQIMYVIHSVCSYLSSVPSHPTSAVENVGIL
jgi:hypothetical protein